MKIKKDLEERYKKYIEKNSNNGYSKCVVDATEAVGNELDEGKSPKEAMGVDNEDVHELTGYMAGCLAQAISHFHPRGEEFRKWWNSQYGVKEDIKGVVNPAIMTIK